MTEEIRIIKTLGNFHEEMIGFQKKNGMKITIKSMNI